MNSPKVSVIIPVYNAGHRLRSCIESILSQTLREIEIIFILDCPKDGSDKVVLEYAAMDSRIIVIKNEKNLNTGKCRNLGIKTATGEYIAFSDHDDIVMPSMYEDMYIKAIATNADIVLGVPEYCYPNQSKNKTYFYPKEGDVREKLLSCLIGRKKGDTDDWEFYYSHGVIWDNLYKSEMVKKNNINFIDNNIVTFEDNLFLIECLFKANKAVVHNQLVYKHTLESTNTAATSAYSKSEKILAYMDYLYNLLERERMLEKYFQNFSNSAARYMISIITRIILSQRNTKGISKEIKMIKESKHKEMIFNHTNYATLIKGSKTPLKKLAYTLIYSYLKWS